MSRTVISTSPLYATSTVLPSDERYDVALEAVCGICALDHSRQLRVSHAGLHASSTNGTWADANLNYVGPGENQFLHHLSCHHVTCLEDVR
ncbi:hypothetical protein NQ318_013080 [Aromia moschata]|uniref:Uncharacterized protein n=1 Tax=Aromia moschata TaxID=1265417 RepID=A0AAV8Y1T0_9CUCU|nr:hypothetical protein NQ318_013080 [Aromia moschata]